MELYIQGKDHGRIIVISVESIPLVWPTIELENDTVRPKTYEELSDKEKLQADCDLKATNIVLQGLSLDVYALVNHHKIAKDICDRVKLLMQGTSCQSRNVSVNCLVVATFLLGDDPIACINKAMAFLSDVFTPHCLSTNNQLISSSNPGNQATVQDGSQGNTSGQAKVIKCYNCQDKWHMARQYNQPKRKRDVTWFNEKVLLVQEHAEGKELDEEQLAFLADPGVADGQLQAKDIVISKLKKTIHYLRENANPDKVKKDIDEIETINIELEHSVAKLLSENEKLHKEKEHLKQTYKELYDSIKSTRVRAKEQCEALIVNLNSKSMENEDLKAQIQEKVFANATLKNELRKLNGKNISDTAVSKPNATTIAPRLFKLDIEPISHRLTNNRTPLNKEKKVRFADPITSSSNTQSQVNSYKTNDSNQPLLHYIGVIYSSGASGSNPIGNIKNNRISQPSCSNKTNKVEGQSRSVKSKKNKKNRVVKAECNAYVMQSMLNVNSKSVCVICNE
nr:hypothetical protein [Tanacetum cinerariifolium]